MLIIAFFCLIGAVGISVTVYAAVDFVKMERTLYKVKKRREISRVEALEEIKNACKRLQNADNDNQSALSLLRQASEYIKDLH